MNLKTGKRGRAVSCLGIHKSDLPCSVWDLVPTVPPFMRRQGLVEACGWQVQLPDMDYTPLSRI